MDNPLVQPDPGLFIWTILTFLVLLALLAKFAWRPLLQALDARHETIRKSLEDAQLKLLGRTHSAAEAIGAYEIARGKFRSVSLDLIYALPDQQLQAWRSELALTLALQPDHLSLYELSIEPGAAFASDTALTVSCGSLPGLRASTNPAPSSRASAGPSRNPRASAPMTTSGSCGRASSASCTTAASSARASAISGVMSLNPIPGFGKSGISRMKGRRSSDTR